MRKERLRRRHFLKNAAGALALPFVIREGVLGRGAGTSPSDRIVMGTIGIGGRGRHVMQVMMRTGEVQMVAVCDVQRERRLAGKNIVDKFYASKDCKAYRDFRTLLARDDIDAVLIATGDNWHSLLSVLAAKAGKDIYCEKPLSVTIAESRAVVQVVKRYGVVFQCGTQRRNVERFRFAVQLARSGKLGQLKELYAEKAPMTPEYQMRTLPPEPEPPAEEMDWDMWLGPAPWRPYNHGYYARRFWGTHLDFSGGAITEWGSHTVDLCQWANNADDTTPVEYEPAEGTIVGRYANGVKLIFEKGKWPLHVKFVGTEGWIYADDGGTVKAEPASLIAGKKFGKGYPAEGHVKEFLKCVRTRRTPSSPAWVAHRSVSACHLANICRRLGRPVRWDPQKEMFIGDPMADRLTARAYRSPWRL